MVDLLAIYGLCFALMNDKIVGVGFLRGMPLFDRMLSCAFCTGFHSGWMVRLILDGGDVSVRLLSWGLAGAAFCYITDSIAQSIES